MPIKFSQFTNRTSNTAGTTIVGFDGNQNIKILSSDLLSGFINGTPHTLPVFATANTLGDSIVAQDASATQLHITGDVGIGTTSPNQKLHVVGHIRVGNNTNTIYANRFKAVNDGDVTLRANDGYDLILNATTGDNVGIGTASPAQKLEVDGNVLLQNNNEIRFKDSGGTERTAIELDLSNNFNIGTSAGGNLRFINGSSYTERMRITSAGNVGIGTDAPATKLHIADATTPTIRIEDTTNGKHLQLFTDNNSSYIRSSASTPIYVQTNGANTRMLISSGGNVGINSTDFTTTYGSVPDLRVGSVSGVGNPGVIDILRKDGDVQAGETTGILQFSVDDDQNYCNAQIEVESDATAQSGNSGGGILKFKTTDSQSGATPTEHMRITNDGNVGIGTTSPTQKLTVDGNIYATGSRQISASYDANHFIRFESLSSGGVMKATDGGVITTLVRSYGDSYFNGGNFGIGTDSPGGLLHVSSGTSGDAIVIIESDTDDNDNSDNPHLEFRQDGNTIRGKIGLEGTAGQTYSNSIANATYLGSVFEQPVQIITGDTGSVQTAKMTILANTGNVGIGTTSPTAPLEVNGNLVFTSENNSITFGGVTSSPSLQITNSSSLSTLYQQNGVLKFDAYNGIEITTGGYNNVINSSGNWGIGTATPSQKLDVVGSIEVSGGIYVGGTGSANYLDDYEEGSFTPSYTGSSGMAVTHDIQIGRYVKIGRLVHFSISLGTDSVGYCSGNLEITGLPFTATDLDGAATPGLNYAFDVSLANYRFTVAQNTSRIRIYNSNSTSQFATCSTASGTNSNRLKLVGTYITTT